MDPKKLIDMAESSKSAEAMAKQAMSPKERADANPKSRSLAIAAKCWDCAGFNKEEVRRCPMEGRCALWPHRPWK